MRCKIQFSPDSVSLNEDDSKGSSGENGQCGGNNGADDSLSLFFFSEAHEMVMHFFS